MSTATVEQTSTVETEAQALHRLADQAKARGVKVIQNVVTNDHFATSVSRPGELHKVTLFSCDCPGFLKHSRCMHFAAVLAMYHSLPPIEAPDTSGPDSGPDGGGAAAPVPTSATSVTKVPSDVVVSIAPAPRRQIAPRVENPRTVHAGTRSDGSTYRILHADAVEIGGRMHRVGAEVLVADWHGRWSPCRITCIRTRGSAGRLWVLDVMTGNGETTRKLTEVRAASSKAVQHAA